MILVDSSVWIDYLQGIETPQARTLDSLLGTTRILVGDLIKAEVLQGVRDDRTFDRLRRSLDALVQVDLAGNRVAVQAARNFRTLRSLGVTVRKTTLTIIATRCIESGWSLLRSDHDFDGFAQHLGLLVVQVDH